VLLIELGIRVGITIRVRVRIRDAYGAKRLGTKMLGYEMSEGHMIDGVFSTHYLA